MKRKRRKVIGKLEKMTKAIKRIPMINKRKKMSKIIRFDFQTCQVVDLKTEACYGPFKTIANYKSVKRTKE